MKYGKPGLWVALALAAGVGTAAAEDGRYQALPLGGAEAPQHSPRALILDTRDGHLWIWSENELLGDARSGRKSGPALIYQGRLKPGQKPGEIVDR